MNSATTMGERLRMTRESAGLTQHKLARRVGCHDQDISRYERGAVTPRMDRLEKLAEAVNVSPAWLLFGEQEATSESEAA